ncbi:hypothetical protein [Pseudomonas aeruginosa]|uniref:hypothetical protein n=1 Tax=Pseudomonas aeruginosa TaxID=287 RepID=UPI00399BA4C6
MTEHPLIEKISFTGGTSTGKKVMASLRAVSGVTSLGLKIIALPAARAGADFHRAICTG